jgi:hypothetical protein
MLGNCHRHGPPEKRYVMTNLVDRHSGTKFLIYVGTYVCHCRVVGTSRQRDEGPTVSEFRFPPRCLSHFNLTRLASITLTRLQRLPSSSPASRLLWRHCLHQEWGNFLQHSAALATEMRAGVRSCAHASLASRYNLVASLHYSCCAQHQFICDLY